MPARAHVSPLQDVSSVATCRYLRVFSSFITCAMFDSVILLRPVRSWMPVLVQPTGHGRLPMHSCRYLPTSQINNLW